MLIILRTLHICWLSHHHEGMFTNIHRNTQSTKLPRALLLGLILGSPWIEVPPTRTKLRNCLGDPPSFLIAALYWMIRVSTFKNPKNPKNPEKSKSPEKSKKSWKIQKNPEKSRKFSISSWNCSCYLTWQVQTAKKVVFVFRHYGPKRPNISNYRTCAMIGRSWLQAALEYKPYIRKELS